jgi:adenylyl cyclase-associated protein
MSKKTSGRVGNLLAAFEKKDENPTQPVSSVKQTVKQWPPAATSSPSSSTSTTTTTTTPTPQKVEQQTPVVKKQETPKVEQQAPPVDRKQEPPKTEQAPVKPTATKVEEPKKTEEPKKVVEQTPPPQKQQQQQQPVVEQKKPVQQQAPQQSADEDVDTVALLALVERLEKAAAHLETIKTTGSSSAKSGSGNSSESEAPQVAAFDEFRTQFVQPFLDTMAALGGQLDKAKTLVSDGFQETRVLVEKASKSKKPASDEALVPHLAPISKIMDQLESLRIDSRQSPFYNHLYALSEGMKCLAWVSVPNTTVSYVKEMINAAQFYTNKVLVDFRKTEQGEVHVKFVEQFKQVINELANYIKEHHMTGLKFNPQGGDLSSATASQAPQQQTQQATPTPQKSTTTSATQSARPPVDLFASISAKKDSAATGLKTVTDDMKTKNRTDKVSVVTEAPKAKPVSNVNAKFQGTPKFELEKGVGEKWVVEYQQNKQDLSITETNLKQNVYVYRCLNSVIVIQGKVKGIVVDGCKKVAIVADSVVSSIEFVNCESCKLQINGEAHTVSVDKTDGFQLFLSKSSLNTKLIASKSSEMNINVPSKTDEDDFSEHPVPEQFVTAYDEKNATFSTGVNSVFM